MINDLPGELAFNARGVEMERECEVCGEWINFGDQQIEVMCQDCHTDYTVNVDGEFRDGSWHNLTSLIKKE